MRMLTRLHLELEFRDFHQDKENAAALPTKHDTITAA